MVEGQDQGIDRGSRAGERSRLGVKARFKVGVKFGGGSRSGGQGRGSWSGVKCPKRLLNCLIKMSYIEIFDNVEKKYQSTKGVQGQPISNQRYPYNIRDVFGPSRVF